jgi:hypothetical protein
MPKNFGRSPSAYKIYVVLLSRDPTKPCLSVSPLTLHYSDLFPSPYLLPLPVVPLEKNTCKRKKKRGLQIERETEEKLVGRGGGFADRNKIIKPQTNSTRLVEWFLGS